jgi:tetratricopeptide (TPR) repeat protein
MAAIEQLYADRLTEQVDRLAYHAFRGEVWDKAVAYFRQAGKKAAARSAYREAAECFEQALGALTHLPESRETIEHGIDLRLDRWGALSTLGELGRVFDHLCEAEILAERIDDQPRLGWISNFMGGHFWISGDLDRAVEAGHRALALARAHADFPLEVVSNARLGVAYLELGDLRRAGECFRTNIESLKGEFTVSVSAR